MDASLCSLWFSKQGVWHSESDILLITRAQCCQQISYKSCTSHYLHWKIMVVHLEGPIGVKNLHSGCIRSVLRHTTTANPSFWGQCCPCWSNGYKEHKGHCHYQNHYQVAMQTFLPALQWKCLHLTNMHICFHKDNSSPHHDANVKVFFFNIKFTLQLQFSEELATKYFWLPPTMKDSLHNIFISNSSI